MDFTINSTPLLHNLTKTPTIVLFFDGNYDGINDCDINYYVVNYYSDAYCSDE